MDAKRLGWTILVGVLALPLVVAAQATPGGDCPGPNGMRGGGRGMMGGRGARGFDVKAVTTVQGEVLEVQRVARGRHEGVHLTVAVGSENVGVRLGPAFHVDAQPLKLAKGDRVEVKGARTTFDGQAVLLAQEVRRGDEVLALRDADGVPLWRGQGRGRP